MMHCRRSSILWSKLASRQERTRQRKRRRYEQALGAGLECSLLARLDLTRLLQLFNDKTTTRYNYLQTKSSCSCSHKQLLQANRTANSVGAITAAKFLPSSSASSSSPPAKIHNCYKIREELTTNTTVSEEDQSVLLIHLSFLQPQIHVVGDHGKTCWLFLCSFYCLW